MPSAASSTVAASTSVVDATSTTDGPVATAAPTTLPEMPSPDLTNGEPFRYSFDDVADVPELPTSIEGWDRYEGADAAGYSGGIRSTELRIFEGDPGVGVIYDFSAQMNRCDESMWIARWVALDSDVMVLATNEVLGIAGDPASVEVEPWMLPPAAPAGIMSGSICQQPGFVFAGTVNGSNSNLVDVAIEWSHFDRDPFAASGGSGGGAASPTTTCTDHVYDDSLPISVCSQGYSVSLFQEALGIEADGYFGGGTEAAVRAFQTSAGLPVTGVMDARTWAALGVTEFAPYPDLNGDGVIDGEEIPST